LCFIRTKILPFAIVALFGIAFFAVSARIWLPGDMMSPAPMNWCFKVLKMTKNKDPNQESLAEIAVDPDVLARELALEIEIDP